MPSAIEEAASLAAKDEPITNANPEPAPAVTPEPAKVEPAKVEPTPEPKADVAPAPDAKPLTAAERAKAHAEKVLGAKKESPKADKAAGDDMSEEEMEEVIRTKPKAWRTYESYKKRTGAEIAELKSKIAAAEAKPNPTAADDTKLKALEKQLEELGGQAKTYQQKLAERDFRESEEYKAKFFPRWNKTYNRAYAHVEKLQILNAEGEPERKATKADFDKLMSVDPAYRRQIAKQMFGEDFAPDLVEMASRLDMIHEEANEAAAEHAANFEKNSKTQAEQTQKQQAEVQQFRQEAQKALETDYPEDFSPDHYKNEPELHKAITDAYAFVDEMEQNAAQMTPQDRAASVAVLRSWAAGFALKRAQHQAAMKKIEELTAELTKFRGSDPSKTSPAPKVEQAPKMEDMSIGDMAKQFNA